MKQFEDEERIQPKDFKFYIQLLKERLLNKQLYITKHFKERMSRDQFSEETQETYRKLTHPMWKALLVTLLDLPGTQIRNVTVCNK